MQNFSNFEKSLEGATSVSKFCTQSQLDFGSILPRGLNMMMYNFDVDKHMLDMWVLLFQKPWIKKKTKVLFQF